MMSMVPASGSGMMEATTSTAQRKPRQTRNVQPEIDLSIPLHPWATTSQLQHLQHHQLPASAPASTSYRSVHQSQPPPPPTSKPQVQPQPHPQYTMSTQPHPHHTFPVAVAPVSTANFYAHPPTTHTNAATYVRATPVPTAKPELQFAPVPALPKKSLPTRADLDFLLGGSSRARAKSVTPKTVAPPDKPRSATVRAPAAVKATPVARPSVQTHIAGPSWFLAAGAEAPASTSRPSLPLRQPSDIPVVQQHDDDLPLGAEAVMEQDDEAGSSFEADNEGEGPVAEKDDPNDRDFRPSANAAAPKQKRAYRRKSQVAEGDAAATASGTKKRARHSLASNSTSAGKVAGSASGWLTPDGPKRRGRPPKEAYTPDMLEQIKAANELLGIAENDQEGLCKKRLTDIIDPQTRQALSPEMRAVLLRARNTQLQRERLKRLREAGIPISRSKPKPKQEAASEEGAGAAKQEEKPKRGGRRHKEVHEDEAETGSGSAIVERAKGKVSEWIKSISSEAGMSNDAEWDDMAAPSPPLPKQHVSRMASSVASSSKQQREALETPASPAPAPAPAPALGAQIQALGEAARADTNIDPRLFTDSSAAKADDNEDDELVQGYFSRFATVTGDSKHRPPAEQAQEGDTFQAGVVGDEYYFSN
ncbi:hypothetical protein EX895_006536 [Sporisorium graminicola]|uniref:Uncharacterized protein n=1 Tax=Sporisorium graminicola TaxID=280036 RepID=A0A4U7KKX5_9BASI|nr:hypothetical protein EX895_006536 [Sporisorium graminicola]TKY84634.1 hypothetical protein EX895_006536 [Sporisorium graminicola]